MTNSYAVLLKMLLDLPPEERLLLAGQFLAPWRRNNSPRPPRSAYGCLLGTLGPYDVKMGLGAGAEERFAHHGKFRAWALEHNFAPEQLRAAELANDSFDIDHNDATACEDRYAYDVGTLAGWAFKFAEMGPERTATANAEIYLQANHATKYMHRLREDELGGD